jgi:hypothetical protein
MCDAVATRKSPVRILSDCLRRRARAGTVGAVAVAAVAIASLWPSSAAPVPSAPDIVAIDLARRSPEIHWPASVVPERANVFSHNEISIDPSCSTVWSHLVAAPQWPNWYPNAQDVRVMDDRSGLLTPRSRFEWITFGSHIQSEVAEFVPERRLAWFGRRPGVTAYHTWLLSPATGGCHVVTEEATMGAAAAASRATNPGGLHAGHELWLTRLKALSEG